MLSKQERKGRDELGVDGRIGVGEEETGMLIARTGDQSPPSTSGIDFGRDRTLVDQAYPLDAAVERALGQFIGDCRNRQDIEQAVRVLSPVPSRRVTRQGVQVSWSLTVRA
jgi:hypothetical protein